GGRTSEAIALYERLGQDLANVNHAQAVLCYNEAAYLRNHPGGGFASSGSAPVVSRSDSSPALALGTPSVLTAAPAPAAGGGNFPAVWSEPGRLRLSGRHIDGKATYVLENETGQRVLYA